jgi:hypothetical protein
MALSIARRVKRLPAAAMWVALLACVSSSLGDLPGDDVWSVAKVATCVPDTLGSSSFRVHQVSMSLTCNAGSERHLESVADGMA